MSTGPWTQIGTTSANITSWANAGLSAATIYYYRVKAYNSTGNSGYTNVASATTQAIPMPLAPSNLAGTAQSSSQINLSWSDNSSDETGFKIERCQGSGCSSFVQITTVGANSTSYQNTSLSSSTSYSYRVRGYNGNGDSGYSNTASAATVAAADTTAPTVPTGLTATAVSSSQINLGWSASTDSGGSGLAGYRVYQSGTLVGSTAATTTTYSSTGLAASTQYCYTVAAYDNTGNVSGQSTQACATTQGTSSQPWSKGLGSTTNDAGQAVAFDSSGNMYVTGYFQGTVNFGGGSLTSNGSSYPDIFLAKYSSTGAHLWSKRFGDVFDDSGYGVAVDSNDNVVVTGYFAGTTDFGGGQVVGQRGYNIFVAKYAADGTYQWAKTFGSPSGGSNIANAVAVDANGNVAITGSFQNSIDFGGGPITANGFSVDTFVVKLSASGAHLWSKGLSGSEQDYGRGISFDSSGNVVVTGSFEATVDFGCGSLTSAGGDDIFVAKYSSTGGCVWLKRFGSSSQDFAAAIAADSSGNIVLTGNYKGTIDFGGGSLTSGPTYPDIFVAKLSATGSQLWSKSFGSTSSDKGQGVAVDSSSNVILTGYFNGTVDFGGGPLTSFGLSTFVAKYSASGAHQWSKVFAGTNSNLGNGVATDRNGNVGVTGWFQGTVDFGQGSLSNAGGLEAFVAELAP